MASTLDQIAKDVGHLLQLVGTVLGAPQGPKQLLASLGWDLPAGVNDIGLAAVDFRSVIASVEGLQQDFDANADEAVIAADAADLLIEIANAFTQVRAVIAALSATDNYLTQTQIKSQLLPRMNDLFAASRIGAASPLGFLFLQLFGVVTMRTFPADPTKFQLEHVRPVIDWDAFPKLFSDPVGLLQSRYGWGTPTFDGGSLVANLSSLIEAIGEPVRTRALPRRVEEQLAGQFIPEADTNPVQQLIASLSRGDASSGLDAGISFFPLRPTAAGASDGGLAVSPFVHGFTSLQFPIAAETTLEFDSSAALDSGVVLQFRPGAAPSLKAGLLGSGGVVDSATGKAIVRVTYGTPGTPKQLLELPGGGVVEFDSIAFAGGVEVLDGKLSPSFGVNITGGHAALRTQGADSFLASVLPGDGLDLRFDLGMSWSADRGFSFNGSAAAELDIPVHLSLPGLEVNKLHIGLRAADSKIDLEVSAGVNAKLGPVTAGLNGVGALASLVFQDGNLGPADLDIGFKPPTGALLSIDASGVVTGGGFLSHDPVTGTYAGAMQLTLQDQLTLSAYGLIATRMPDGQPGYSLLVFITADGFQPVPLGLGFMLTSIGGLIAVNRTFDYDVLQAGLKSDTLATLLFPSDPVGNAPAIIQALAAAFPAKSGSFLFGLLAQITWFTPTLITLDLGLVLEVGSTTRLLVLGRATVLLPTADNDLVRLVLDAIGELELDTGALSVDAMLVDSRLLHRFPITGSAAVRAHWGNQAGATDQSFVLAAGGFNPRFAAPAGFPTLDRLSISLTKGTNPRLECEAYLAITSNTLQFGAHASLYAEAIGFSLTGDIGFDALISWAPLHFLADFEGKVQLKRGSHNLFKLELNGSLEGPQPLRLSGKVSFEIFWISFTVRIDATLADGAAPDGLAAVNVSDLLAAAVGATSNWRTQLTSGVTHGVALRAVTADTGTVLDPLGQMVFEQQVVPLNLTRDVDTYGGAPVAGPQRFALTGKLNDTSATAVQGAFAPARFFVMSDDEKLAAPSFEAMDAGLLLGDASVHYAADAAEAARLEYDPITLNPDSLPSAPAADTNYQMPAASLAAHVGTGAAAQAPVRQVGRARFRNSALAPVATVTAPQWTIVRNSDGTAAPATSSGSTWSEQRAALNLLNRGGSAWTMVPAHELAAA
jgi:hypothetical protein